MVSGYYTRTIKKRPFESVCPNCEASIQQNLEVICKVNHSMFIPYYASKKQVVRSCGVCGKKYYLNSEHPIYKEAEELKKKTKYPFYYFIGLLPLILLLFGFIGIFVSVEMNKKQLKAALPQKVLQGYTIIQKLDDGLLSTMIIVAVSNDSVYVRENMKAINKNALKIDEIENYSTLVKVFTQKEIEQMIQDDKIKDIVMTTTYFNIVDTNLLEN